MQTAYADHDVDEDPVIVLPCGHFYAASTLDGHLGLASLYEIDSTGLAVGLKPLRGADVNEKPKQCPKCRAVIHSVRRYGRILRLSEIRSLERKHLALIRSKLTQLASVVKTGDAKTVAEVKRVEKEIRQSPMTKVFEACGGKGFYYDVPRPPALQLIQILELKAVALEAQSDKSKKKDGYSGAIKAYENAIVAADESNSTASGGRTRLALGLLLVKVGSEKARQTAGTLLEWLEEKGGKFVDLVDGISRLRSLLGPISKEEMKKIIQAMAIRPPGEYNYGGSPSDHWYECPNGHPYFIGDCGMAMMASTCRECEAQIGGASHTLNPTNRRAQGVAAQALRELSFAA
jgi:hypothetical protein